MRRIMTITIDVQENDAVPESDRWDELEYWTGQVENAFAAIKRDYDGHVDRANDRVDYQAIDFTNISMSTKEEDPCEEEGHDYQAEDVADGVVGGGAAHVWRIYCSRCGEEGTPEDLE